MTPLRWAIDVGNTRVKIGAFEDGRLLQVLALRHSDQLNLDGLLAFGRPRDATLATVAPADADRLLDYLADCQIHVSSVWRSDGAVFRMGLLTSDVDTPDTTGVDRLMSAVGALARAPGRDVLVVDCGSAITVNATSTNRVFRGGAILPGLRLMASSLNRNTAALPYVPIGRLPSALGRSTHDAIAAGVAYAALGGVERIVRELSSGAPAPAIFLTGGDAELLSPALSFPHTLAPDLVLEGIYWASARRSEDRG
jgi:type III pantothenate kinase